METDLETIDRALPDLFATKQAKRAVGPSHTLSFRSQRLNYQSEGEPAGQILLCTAGEINIFGHDGEWSIPSGYMVYIPAHRAFRMRARTPADGLVVKFCHGEVSWGRTGCWVAAQTLIVTQLAEYSLKWTSEVERQMRQTRAFFVALGEMVPNWFCKERVMWSPYGGSPAMQRVVDYTRLKGLNVTLPEVAAHVGMSERTLRRHMQIDLGQSWREFIREFRMNRAMELLRKDRKSVTEVAFEVGFSSSSAFSNAFADYAGTTPSTFARTARKALERAN